MRSKNGAHDPDRQLSPSKIKKMPITGAMIPRIWAYIKRGLALTAIIVLIFSSPKKSPFPMESPAKAQDQPFTPGSNIELTLLPRREEVELTIYNSADLTLVRDMRTPTLKKGWNHLQFSWIHTLIDPTSLSLEMVAEKEKVEVHSLTFPPRSTHLGRWLLCSEFSGTVPVEILYLTSGVSWRAFYMGTLSSDETYMHLSGYVRIENRSGEDYGNAHTRLIVGKVHILDNIAELAQRRYPYGKPDAFPALPSSAPPAWGIIGHDVMKGIVEEEVLMQEGFMEPKKICKEGLSEYFLYTIEGTETIPHGWGKRLPCLDVYDIPIKSLYKYDEERWAGEAQRFISFANTKEDNLGNTPLPNGTMRLFRYANTQHHLAYMGKAEIKYIPVNEEVELNIGPARLVRIEPRLISMSTENYLFDHNGDVAGWDEITTWQLKIHNSREIPITCEIMRNFDTPYWKLATQGPAAYTKHDARHARFVMDLTPRSDALLTYTLTTYHGTRQQFL
ncbi:MAG: hypothetical protein ACMUJM_16500 [bacterium]